MFVYVTEIKKTPNGIQVTATNRGEAGPPFLQWIAEANDQGIIIGSAYKVTIERHDR